MFLRKKLLHIYIHVPKCAGTSFWQAMKEAHSKDTAWWAVGPHIYQQAKSRGVHSRINQPYIEGLCKKVWIEDFIKTQNRSWRRHVNYIYGHAAYYGIHECFDRDARYYVILRKPQDLVMSLYNYLCGLEKNKTFQQACKIYDSNGAIRSFEKWIEVYPQARNHMTWFLAQAFDGEYLFDHTRIAKPQDLAVIEQGLREFYLVGQLQNSNSMSTLYRDFGLKSIPFANTSKSHTPHAEIDKTAMKRATSLDEALWSLLGFSKDKEEGKI